MSPCRICTEPTKAGRFADHEVICATCLDEAVLDAYLADLPDEPIIREQVTRAFFTARRTRRDRPEPADRIEAIEIDGERLPLPDDLHISELMELLGPDVEITRMDERHAADDHFSADDDYATGPLSPAPRFPALANELHRLLPPLPLEDTPDDEVTYPGYRLFRVLERIEVEGEEPRWAIRRVYRRE